jgi:hypothetical protein
MNIPLPKARHWQKILVGKGEKPSELTSDYSGDNEVVLSVRQKGDNKGTGSHLSGLQNQIENDASLSILVPDRLSNPDKLIIAARDSITRKDIYVHDGIVWTERGLLDIKVAPKNVSRALRFMDTFIKVIRARGHKIIIEYDSTYVLVSEEKIKITFREKLKRTVVKNNNWETNVNLPTGVLTFRADISFTNSEWKDGKIPLEQQISKILYQTGDKGKGGS